MLSEIMWSDDQYYHCLFHKYNTRTVPKRNTTNIPNENNGQLRHYAFHETNTILALCI